MKNKSGFTLMETLISLLVLGIIFQIISFSTRLMTIPVKQRVNSEDWQILINELESSKHQFRLKSNSHSYVYLNSLAENKIYKLEKYKDQLRFSPGYMPLISQINAVDFDYQEPFLKLQIKFNDGEVKKDDVYIPKD
ncbi:prepilin-type N-terminal cleavage/methylation domain-containing protein [Pediococcus ethanolidurans]|uniref:competence type IV pilus minor pilin ComGF n=1 Tax=Pediococcus ethanolidurans TaxID=319653 RepID=UPI0029535F90|nr:competence type IV pilus minor pilin ComGF [Pediococcus ethanolidurans]MDV7720110.1 prepilin-type N-terminal cleavage/methylation domain-containing protein [Pediococcus ethanolidurans]